jgi:hypothetical protein
MTLEDLKVFMLSCEMAGIEIPIGMLAQVENLNEHIPIEEQNVFPVEFKSGNMKSILIIKPLVETLFRKPLTVEQSFKIKEDAKI